MLKEDYVPAEAIDDTRQRDRITERLNLIAGHGLWTNGLLLAIAIPLWLITVLMVLGFLMRLAGR